MSYTSKKYNIPDETITQMVRDGVLDWRIDALWDFYQFYLALKQSRGSSNGEIRDEIIFHYGMSYRLYYYYLAKARLIFEK